MLLKKDIHINVLIIKCQDKYYFLKQFVSKKSLEILNLFDIIKTI